MAGPAPDYTKIPLQDQDGHRITLADFKGKNVFISFIYTKCVMPNMCPLTVELNQKLHAIWMAQANREPLQILFVTLDPAADSPVVLKSFAASRGLESSDYTLATGSASDIANLTAAFSASAAPGLGGISHTPTSVLLDKKLKLKEIFALNHWKPEDVVSRLTLSFDDRSRWKSQTVTLGNFEVSKVFPAMSGPTKQSFLKLNLSPGIKHAWIKGLDVTVFSYTTKKQMPLHLLCHAWLDVTNSSISNEGQAGLLTISEGMEHSEFPPGYGMLVSEGQTSLQLTAQAVNDDPTMNDHLSYRFKVYYVEDPENSATPPLAQLRQFSFYSLGPPAVFDKSGACVGGDLLTQNGLNDHFLVPPGRHVYEKIFPKGTFARVERIHNIKVHLHRFGQSIALIDETTGKTLWTGKASYEGGQISAVSSYSSSEGIEVRPDHSYRVVAEYYNWTQENASGMAVLRTYVAPEEENVTKAASLR